MVSDFNKVVLKISLVILCISLILYSILLAKAISNDRYPTNINDCPDYWNMTLNSENKYVCVNQIETNTGRDSSGNSLSGNIISDKYSAFDLSLNDIDADKILCAKYNWAKENSVIWDGVTNNNRPCE